MSIWFAANILLYLTAWIGGGLFAASGNYRYADLCDVARVLIMGSLGAQTAILLRGRL